MAEQVWIDRRFRGPPESANGGYSVGLVAGLVGGPAEVTLKAPPPLDEPLVVAHRDDVVSLEHEGRPVAEGRATSTHIDVPAPVSFAEASEAARSFIGFEGKTFMECFVCGPHRSEGDGLRIFAGEVDGRDLVAAPWIPDPSLVDDDGLVGERYMWSALDCPTYFAGVDAFGESKSLLGRLSGWVGTRATPGTPLVVMAWPISREGRKRFAASAIVSDSGDVIAAAHAIWIEPRA